MAQPEQQTSPIEQLRASVAQMLETLDPSQPIAAIVLFEVDPRKEQEFATMADSLTAATRRLPGCNVFCFHKAHKAANDRVEYLIYEDWETVRLFQSQWSSVHLSAFQHRVGDVIVATPDLRFYTGWRNAAEPARETSGETPVYASAFRFSWAMSLFGAQQMVNLLSPTPAARAMDDVTASAEAGLSEPLRAMFRAGDALLGSTAQPRPSRPQSAQPPPSPAMGERDISAEYPYQPHYAEVFGSRMHYIEQGTGDPILLVHGNPSWSYSWRNIIPHLSGLGRCIAPDLIGFGRSDKPDIEYRWFDHARYLEAFIAKLGLKNVTLVLHDQGSALGLHYAMRNEANVKAIAFF